MKHLLIALLTLALTLAFSNMMDEMEIENQSQG